jgi:hypothetical protein
MIDRRLDVLGSDVVKRNAKALVNERVGLGQHQLVFGATRT